MDTVNTQPFFYGFFERDGKRYCYVFLDGKLGYFSVEIFKPITLPRHADAMPVFRKQEQTSSKPTSSTVGRGFFASDTNKVIFITITCIVAVCAVYLIFLPKKQTVPSDEDPAYD